jgi:autotransporter-associated beta strand protein
LNNGTLNTANFTSTSGNATVSGTVFVNTINYTAGSGSFAIESGTVSVGGSAPSISVNASRTLTINITLAGSTDWSKAGAGTLVLAGANTYTGNTTISAGVLNIRHNNALGATGAGNGTTINSGAALQLSNNITIAETISLNSTGIGGSGGINNLSGSNIISGAITSGSANTEGI